MTSAPAYYDPAKYHGGDIIYKLVDIPGIWHEQCLSPA